MKQIYEKLEYDKILNMLADCAVSDMGREMCLALEPSHDLEGAKRLQEQTREAAAFLQRFGGSPLQSFSDVREQIKRSAIAGALSMGELLRIGGVLRASRVAKAAFRTTAGIIRDMAEALIINEELENAIFTSIIAEDEMADAASAELADIRRRIRAANGRIRDRLNSMIHSASYQKYLQEPIITVRNGRFVLPVKQEYRTSVPGMIHDQSSSGATLFIEPSSIVEINNEIKRLEAEERNEIERILMALTARVAEIADELSGALYALASLDLVFARATLGLEMRATEPEMTDSGQIRLRRARHPLIPKDKVVPVDIELGGGIRGLIITGPNTGGKTVTLKTAGLLTLMAQAGMYVPAEYGAVVNVFDSVFADIGDEQSIEQSLSTFSSHMTNLVGIVKNAGANSLVLLDELGAGTDPTEGAALAMSILDELIDRGCTILSTTHYSELKVYAMTKPGISNASMEFDVETLRPTFRLLVGMPGHSNAFAISSRLGLPDEIIERARGYVSGERARFEEALKGAQEQRQKAERERAEAEEARRELARLRDEAREQSEKLSEQKRAFLEKAREEARAIVENAKVEADSIISEIRQIKREAADANERALAARAKLRAKGEELAPRIEHVEATGEPPKKLKPGDTVRVLTVDKVGTVLSASDVTSEATVQIGIMKMNVAYDQLRREKAKPEKQVKQHTLRINEMQVPQEVHVRMQTLDEALLNVDAYLDDAFLAGYKEVRIVHGKGTGTLRNGIQQFLRSHPHVKSFRLGRYGEGESGVTIVELK